MKRESYLESGEGCHENIEFLGSRRSGSSASFVRSITGKKFKTILLEIDEENLFLKLRYV
jgi:hypothetical protein